jgi:Dolichyl-phosphate-mannose-protein mannosyltransferase
MNKSYIARIAMIACLLFAVLATLQHHKSYTADEVYELRNHSTNWSSVANSPDGFPPLYSWLLGHFASLFSVSNARLFSALTAIIGLFFVAAAGWHIDKGIGIRAALFYSISACQLEYAQQVRAYSLYICVGAIVVWAAVRVIYAQRRLDWGLLVLSSVASLWTHYFAAPFLVGIWLGVLVLGWIRGPDLQSRKSFCASYAVAAGLSVVLLIPWFHPLRVDLQSPPPVEAINPVDLTGIAYTYMTLVQGWCFGPSQIELFEWNKGKAILAIAPWASLTCLMFVSLVLYGCMGSRTTAASHEESSTTERSRVWQVSFSIWMASLIVLIPLGSALLAVSAGSSFVARYLAVLVVPFSLLMGAGSCFGRSLSWRGIASYALVLINFVSFLNRNFSDRHDRENFQQLISIIKQTDDSPRLLALSHYLGHAIEYQVDSSVSLTMVGLNSDEPDNWDEIRNVLEAGSDGQRLWLTADWMRPDDLRLAKRNRILADLGAKFVKRVSGTLDLFVVDSKPQTQEIR